MSAILVTFQLDQIVENAAYGVRFFAFVAFARCRPKRVQAGKR